MVVNHYSFLHENGYANFLPMLLHLVVKFMRNLAVVELSQVRLSPHNFWEITTIILTANHYIKDKESSPFIRKGEKLAQSDPNMSAPFQAMARSYKKQNKPISRSSAFLFLPPLSQPSSLPVFVLMAERNAISFTFAFYVKRFIDLARYTSAKMITSSDIPFRFLEEQSLRLVTKGSR